MRVDDLPTPYPVTNADPSLGDAFAGFTISDAALPVMTGAASSAYGAFISCKR